jgi:hypothetical protein
MDDSMITHWAARYKLSVAKKFIRTAKAISNTIQRNLAFIKGGIVSARCPRMQRGDGRRKNENES